MKKIEFSEIGTYECIRGANSEKNLMQIQIRIELANALIHLKLFSHCLIFTKNEDRLSCYTGEIVEIMENNAKITMNINEVAKYPVEGILIDIKPYFPCEEIVEGYFENPKHTHNVFNGLNFKKDPIGEYIFHNHDGRIQFSTTNNIAKTEMEEVLKQIHPGDILRVLWWFHRFDDKKYRNHLMCNPPYERAPKSGVFATRSPVRPNPIASTIVKVKDVDQYHHSISILGFDGFEHSAILQIMPYKVANFSDITVPEWVDHWTEYKIFREVSTIEITSQEQDNIIETENMFSDDIETEENTENLTNEIVIEHACLHNLKDISVRIPKEKITVITGVSGSGKSTLAFDTIYHESQKQFIDLVASNSPLGNDMNDSKVSKITGLQPSIAIEQRNLAANPRSTVASVTKTGDYLKLLFVTLGERICPNCNKAIPKNNVCDSCGEIFFELTPAVFHYNHPEHMCPVCKGLGEELCVDTDLIISHPEKSILDGASLWWGNLRKYREKPNANWMRGEALALAEFMKVDLEVPFKDLPEEFKSQLFYGSNGKEVTLHYENPNGRSGTISRPVEGVVNTIYRLLTDNNAEKAMVHLERFLVNNKCSRCQGERLLEEGRLVRIAETRYPEATRMNITQLKNWCHNTYCHLDLEEKQKAKGIFIKLVSRLKKLEQVGLHYLNLDRSIPSLSGGEAQRLKIASQFGSGLSNILYVMDEPSKGLHPKDFRFLIDTIEDLKKQKNTVLIVEHKKEFINNADFLIEIGPKAGKYGGELLRAETVFKSNFMEIDEASYRIVDKIYDDSHNKKLVLQGAKTNNLKDINVTIPLGKFISVIGVSGSGKSSLIAKTLYPAVQKELGLVSESTGKYESITGVEHLKTIHYVSQRAIGKNSRSTPGTYTGVFDMIREFYARLPQAKDAKLLKEHFSFNSTKGQCEECKGTGETTIPMHFMPDIYTTCVKCHGKRYQDKVLSVLYKGYSISDILELEIGEVEEIFKDQNEIFKILHMLDKVGLSYIKFGQNATTLSGGESQRIKLAKELCTDKVKDAMYLLDEPTSGLHEEDVQKLIYIIKELTEKGATVVIVEHNPIIIKASDYMIELGPVGGEQGGSLMNAGWNGEQYEIF